MGGRLTIGSVAGIDIRIHRSWIFIALLITWSLWSRFVLADHGAAAALAMAVIGAILFFGSVLVHELAHSLEARRRGVEVDGITLFLFGGATEMRLEVQRPRDEFALTAIGPFSSCVLAALFGLVAFYTAGTGLDVVADVTGPLAYVNLALGLFNLLPGAPLDGGRILRSAVWAITGDRRRAIRVASRSGQVIGYLIAALGLVQLLFADGGLIGGLWLIFIGWFLAAAAQSEIIQHQLGERLQGTTVGDVLQQRALPAIDAAIGLDAAADRLGRQPHEALTVSEDGGTVGVLLLDDVAEVPPARRRERAAGEVAVPIDELPSVDSDTKVLDAMAAVRRGRPLVVTMGEVGHERVRGVIMPEQLQRTLRRTLRLASDREPGSGQPSGDAHLPDSHPS